MSIKGIIISVVSALAGATLIAFGGYYAGRHRKNVQLQSEINSLSTENKELRAYHYGLLAQICELRGAKKGLEKKNSDNVEKAKELEEKCNQLNEQLDKEKQINAAIKNEVDTLKNETARLLELVGQFKQYIARNKTTAIE